MTDQFLGEIRVFPFNFAPVGWASCNGQVLQISQNTALFSLLGTNYGGNGTSTFALPNLQGSVPLHTGQGPGLSLYDIGETGGATTVTLENSELPAHTHFLNADSGKASSPSPSAAVYHEAQSDSAGAPAGAAFAYNSQTPTTALNANTVGSAGGGQPHNNLMPYLTLNFCIALTGIFPARS
jgi:microcystin-dependent protein